MKNYYRVMLGKSSSHAKECFAGSFIGAGYNIPQDLTPKLTTDWRAFNREMILIYLARHPNKTKVAAGLACGALWTMAKGINQGDTVLSHDGAGHYHVGEVNGDYYYQSDPALPHRRSVKWRDQTIDRADMSEALKLTLGAPGAIRNITGYSEEIQKLLGGMAAPALIDTGEAVEDPVAFAMERHLEDFLVKNWSQTDLGKEYNIYEEEGEKVGQQYPTDTGPVDILAVSKDKKTLLVVELKRGRASDVVVGQILRYMGYVKEELAEKGQNVKGVIIALEDDQNIRRALAATSNITFYRYQVSFKLMKA